MLALVIARIARRIPTAPATLPPPAAGKRRRRDSLADATVKIQHQTLAEVAAEWRAAIAAEGR